MSQRSWTPQRMRTAILDVLQNGKTSDASSRDNGVPARTLRRYVSVLRSDLSNEAGATMSDPNRTFKRIFCISDLHAPYHHQDSLEFIAHHVEEYRPDCVVIGGDELDFHAISFHDSDPDLDSASGELKAGRRFLRKLERIVPNALVLESNHGSLAYRRAKAHGLPKHLITSYRAVLFGEKDIDGEIFYPSDRGRGWKWFPDLILNTQHAPVYFCHGKKSRTESNIIDDKMCFVQFHHHSKYEVVYVSTPSTLLWGMTSGCMIDKKALAFSYNKYDAKRPIIGCSKITDGHPQLLPMELDHNGRWIGRKK